jgi:hypothetical protein
VEGFLSKLTDLTYDMVGVLMPGLALLLVGAFEWRFFTFFSTPCPEPTFVALATELLRELAATQANRWWLALLVIAAYFAGRVALFLARDGLPLAATVLPWVPRALEEVMPGAAERLKKARTGNALLRTLARLFLLPTPKTLLEAHAGALDGVRARAVAELGTKAPAPGLDAWLPFYSVATRVIEQESTKSRLPVHQSKYTLDRSLGTVFALGFWTSLAMCVRLPAATALPPAAAFLVLVHAFEQDHARHWRLWGDSVIAETYALVWRKKP